MRYRDIVKHYESCFQKHGDTHKGVDWPNANDALVRYGVMNELIDQEDECTLLDLGCGAGHFLEFLLAQHGGMKVKYTGADLSALFISHCKNKYPHYDWMELDVLQVTDAPSFDYVVMNGLFTEKLDASYDDMWSFFKQMILKVWSFTEKGIAFNLMSSHVDWQRDDLFHVPMDELGHFLHHEVSMHFTMRRDYGLYEYTVYVYKKPMR